CSLAWTLDHMPVKRLREAIQAAAGRHEILRTVFTRRTEEYVQSVNPYWQSAVTVHDLRNAQDPAAPLRTLALDATSREPQFRAAIAVLSEQVTALILSAGAVLCDRRGLRNLAAEIVQLATLGSWEELPGPVQYGTYARAQRALLSTPESA